MRLSRITPIVLFLFLAASAFARKSDVPATPSAPPIIVAKAGSWLWSDVNAWTPAAVPGDGAVVRIPSGATVTLRGDSARIKWIEVVGTGRLALSFSLSSRLFVETLFVDGSASFTLSPALPQGMTAQVIFISSGPLDTVWDKSQISRGLIAEGRVTVLGAPKTPFVQVTSDVTNHLTTTLTVNPAPVNWQPNDEVVLTASYFRRNAPLQDERRQIVSVNGTTVTVNGTFNFDHLHVSPSMHLHLANVTRNVTFRSETTTNTYDRGHVMLEHRDTDIEQAAFVNLGRTDKSKKLDDVIYDATNVLVKKPTGAVTNPRGRYSVHVHETEENPAYLPWTTPPATAPTTIKGCVVDGAIGWGFVSHSSYVDFRDDVAVNFTGSGFVTEGGDELGNFINDIAIHGVGDGVYRKVRLNFGNLNRPQPLADFAFSGHGFWFSGPMLRVSGIVANSCNGDGVIWHPTGTVDVLSTADAFVPPQTGYPNGRYHYIPDSWIPVVYAGFPGYNQATFRPRHWVDPQSGVSTHALITDLPILQSDNIDSYANLIGFRPRFSNHDSVDFFNEVPVGQPAGQTKKFGYDSQIVPVVPGDNRAMPSRITQTIGVVANPAAGLRLWNNEEAIGLRYVDKTSWYYVNAVNRLDYDETAPANNPGINPSYGIEMFFALAGQTFNSLTLDGYEMAGWRINGSSIGAVAFAGKSVLNNAADETWTTAGTTATSPAPANPRTDLPSGTSIVVRWDAVAAPTQYLIRYRPTGAQQWKYKTAAANATSATLTLLQHTTYQYQIDAGVTNGISYWTIAKTFVIP
jgi:hypothetical protein